MQPESEKHDPEFQDVPWLTSMPTFRSKHWWEDKYNRWLVIAYVTLLVFIIVTWSIWIASL